MKLVRDSARQILQQQIPHQFLIDSTEFHQLAGRVADASLPKAVVVHPGHPGGAAKETSCNAIRRGADPELSGSAQFREHFATASAGSGSVTTEPIGSTGPSSARRGLSAWVCSSTLAVRPRCRWQRASRVPPARTRIRSAHSAAGQAEDFTDGPAGVAALFVDVGAGVVGKLVAGSIY